MGRKHDEIAPPLQEWIGNQKLFFVATAPLSGDGMINCSPKGLDTFRVLGPREVIYLDLTGSGIETMAHLRENGRIVLMFCAFDGAAKIVRLHGRGEAFLPGSPEWDSWIGLFPNLPGSRAIVRVAVSRVSDSCGYGVPKFEHVEDRKTLPDWARKKGAEAMAEYRQKKNTTSIDGMPGLPTDD